MLVMFFTVQHYILPAYVGCDRGLDHLGQGNCMLSEAEFTLKILALEHG